LKPKVTAFVPIKLNSQRLPGKNILPLGRQRLCWYIFDTLLGVNGIDEVCVYCSDIKVADYIPKEVTFIQRDPHLDGDEVKGNEIYGSFINQVDSDIYLLAHTTSPFLARKSVEHALGKVLGEKYDSALSVQKKQTFVWYKGETLNYQRDDVPRTQDIEPIYIETSGFYIFQRDHFLTYKSRIGFHPYFQEVNDMEAIDIDTGEDYEFALQIAGRSPVPMEVAKW
jgi:CMP-N-acetylneuraminic acid synthetase